MRTAEAADEVRVEDGGRRVVVVAGRLRLPVSAGVTDAQALTLARAGTTAWHLLRTCAHLRPDESIVVHDAASEIGAIAVQLARSFAAGRVIATETSQARRRRAVKLGADVAVDSGRDGLAQRVIGANEGRQVDVVLDPGGALEASLDALAPFGRIVCYGADQDESIKLTGLLGGSRAVIGFRFEHTLDRPDMIARAVSELFGLTSAGRLRPMADS
ncbi:NADPH2:quinone reductase [Lentzea waywayandensis]|uniref:NADPH2:quinone reductase n=1 Tax=Lentzea waywayandensis TaxID=84724 RepID=A0A1I6FFQ5_9PSEU|nr:zinc-binding dehydrogenase [Lentzea waywayandensis]SFR28617.1 NADPH2:quinone reductase [Lentzea waywayandensis]